MPTIRNRSVFSWPTCRPSRSQARLQTLTGMLVLALFQSAPALAQRTASPTSGELKQLLHDAWEARLQASPLFATACGDHRRDDKLDEVGLQPAERYSQIQQQLLQRAKAIAPKELSIPEQLDWSVLQLELENGLQEYHFQSYLIPITNREGFHTEFARLGQDLTFQSRQDYENYLARLRAFPQYVDGHIELLRAGLQAGLVLPAVSVDGIDNVLKPLLVTQAEQSPNFEPFTRWPATMDTAAQEELRQAGKQAILEQLVPGYQKFLEFMVREYVPKARLQIGASALPNGREFYRFRVRKFTTLDVTPEEVHKIGNVEVDRIQGEMKQVLQQAGFTGSLTEYRAYLRTNPKFQAPSAQALLTHTAGILKRADGELPRLFRVLPRTPYGLRPIPDFIAPKTSSAYYLPPAGDGTRAGFFYLNTYDLKSRPLYQLEALSLHEAVPGHHLQLALQQEMELSPQRKFSDVTAFIEGWGLYAERLGLELGMYQTPEDNFGRLSFESWRACRLVVDTGIHYLGWSRQQAIDFLLEHTALSAHDATMEVDRYISWPGQALAYKMGELQIRKLRQQAETELGSKFDIREFHDVVLRNGALPLNLLSDEVARYLAEKKRKEAH